MTVFAPTTCNWLIETQQGWQVCGLPVSGNSVYGDKAPLCRTHLADEGKAVSGRLVKKESR